MGKRRRVPLFVEDRLQMLRDKYPDGYVCCITDFKLTDDASVVMALLGLVTCRDHLPLQIFLAKGWAVDKPLVDDDLLAALEERAVGRALDNAGIPRWQEDKDASD